MVLAHGVTAHKDRPLLIALAEACSAGGLASLRISYAGNGESEGRFEDSVPSKEVEDLGAVIDAVEQWGVARIASAGHSMGGAVGVLRTSRDARSAAGVAGFMTSMTSATPNTNSSPQCAPVSRASSIASM